MLSDRYLGGIPEGSRASKERSLSASEITSERLDQIQKLNEIASRRGQSLAQMAIAWVLRQPAMTSALVGVSSVAQLESNVAALNNLTFSGDELRAIDQIAGA